MQSSSKSTALPTFGAFREHEPEPTEKKKNASVRFSLTAIPTIAITQDVKRKTITRKDVIRILRERQGKLSINKFAAELGVSQPHLSDIYNGKRDPGEKVLSKIGLARKTVKSDPIYETV